jgi:hypothetical protein
MLMNSIVSSTGDPDFDSLEKATFAPALILPKSEVTGAVVSMDGRGLELLRGGGLIAMGIITYADIFGDLHLVQFCHRAQFGPIDWEGVPAGQPLRIRGIACETHNCEDNECGADWQARATAVAAGGPREAMCAVRRQHNADAHVTSWPYGSEKLPQRGRHTGRRLACRAQQAKRIAPFTPHQIH